MADGGNTFIERTMDFLACFCSILKPDEQNNETDHYIEHPFVFEIISHLLEVSFTLLIISISIFTHVLDF